MTALTQYDRLESGGLWRATPEDQRREVGVSFGDATLVISDSAGRPLTHWSLPAVERINPGARPALFAPDTEATETLEIDDPLMIDAIEKVRKTLARRKPRPGKLRGLGTLAVVTGLAALAVFWLPGALRDQTVAVVPQSKRAEFGATILGHMQAQTGPACRSELGREALEQLRLRLLGPGHQGQIVVLPHSFGGAIALPGGVIVIDQTLLTQYDDPAVFAGYVVAANATRRLMDPLGPVIASADLSTAVTLLTSGDLPPDTLADYAAQIMEGALPQADTATLLAAFDAARLSSSPYAKSLGLDNTDDLIARDPLLPADMPLVLSDDAWVSLQGICDI